MKVFCQKNIGQRRLAAPENPAMATGLIPADKIRDHAGQFNVPPNVPILMHCIEYEVPLRPCLQVRERL
ncbi:hypothetical protein BwSH20_74820 [Bradyrhizobium ottawaense]|nr:hypothetical protein BJA01nite_78280 [Bradyrhizobium japonicum]GMO10656.1 hypothetical protein BwSH20_74820 [Bradyrhizobium ottawaense]GMO35622.1 hypothetical protein BwSF12_35510 [Bradyrhizobium ottawaense]GMO49750.1 hypothetical protein BwSF21_70380 [Bradyrhizobium ottawaense]GMO51161.1 hypothetical protein BwSH14_72570 [Bradyrhizobium ottawaense]